MKRLILIAFFVIFSVSLYAEIKIGALFSTSGPASFLGLPEKQTLDMVVEEINKNGGINGEKIKIIFYDTKGIDGEARKKFIRLATKDRVLAVIGPTRSGSTLAIKDLAKKYKLPVISCASSNRIINPLYKEVFKVAPSDIHAVEKIYEYLLSKGMKKVAIITAQSGFGYSGRDALLKKAKEMNIHIVADEKFKDTDKDMKSQLSKIASLKPDAVICWGVGPAPAIVAKNFKELNINAQLIMSHGVASKKFIALAGNAAENIILPAGRLIVADQLPDTDPFKKMLLKYKHDYETKFNSEVSTFGGHAYDAMHILKIALENTGKNKNKIAKAIESIKGYKGTYGEFNFSEKDHNGLTKDAFVMVKIENGDWKLIHK
ncbi:ABC transporter substrate-binding protein [Deferribacter autotrophicus]|uniref:ABC transporter substrate-binding protein n=1 Tax=Deferribacter autotrophicus TaxID=500465 RepID=A0A5A8F6T9_9BACT|nr:ABC transporter substrate-binding protein [Deferribacter autotrophicus]KAA0259570.1 ABC transporter substrate-binding protein [Deferribacter autotrophicus]